MIIADAITPGNIQEMVGQKHIVGENALLNSLVENGGFDSLCFMVHLVRENYISKIDL